MSRQLSRRCKRNELTLGGRGFLLFGFDLGEFDFPGGDTAAREVWRQHRVPLLLDWIARRPFTRPYAWWEWEKPRGELRQQISGPPPLKDSPICMGFPHWWPDKTLTFESEFSFLRRLNLFTRDESRLLREKTLEEVAALELPSRKLLPEVRER
jgi:hypothetical protein